jgi:hypothetical protein
MLHVRRLTVAAVAAAGLALPGAASASYGWPLAPTDRQHAVRGFFDDPRQQGTEPPSFHFGVDVCGPDGAAVYAVAAGVVRLQADGVALVAESGDRVFSYWHVTPTVADLTHVKPGDALGTIKPGFGHVHFVERHGDRYVNPLRPGGMAPYVDTTSPTVASLGVVAGTRRVDPGAVRGVVDLVVDAYDTPSAPLPPAPWDSVRVAPAYIRWRLVPEGAALTAWHTALDFRSFLAPSTRYTSVYAPWTRLNRPNRPGVLVFYLAHAWDTRLGADGRYRLDVAVFDTRGNSARAGQWLTVANG